MINKLRDFFAKSSVNFKRIRENGDSLVEVALSVTVLSLIAVGSMLAMNRGNSAMQNTLVRTEVRAIINTQTNALQYIGDNINNSMSGEWSKIKGYAFKATKQSDINNMATKYTINNSAEYKSFYIVPNGITAASGGGKSLSLSSAPGEAWVDAACFLSNVQPYCDFYIKASWQTPGNQQKSHTITIVRIYE